jgi:ubiquinone/menaquinone biosynthesis C-methylase UbiE
VVQLAVRVGEKGKVYAEDIHKPSLDHLKKRCERWDLDNVEIILGEVTDPMLPEKTLDMIFIISTYHHFEDPVALMRNARPSLKSDGKVAIGEWLAHGNSTSSRTTPEDIEAQMKEAGFKLEKIDKFLEMNNMYIYIFSLDD